MNEKLSLYNIAELMAEKTGVETAKIENFIIELITLINEGIRKDGIVKIKGFGIFKIILVKERESVHINTGERIMIPAHHKLSFKPDEELKELINQPFSIFETIEATDENLKKSSDLVQSETNDDANEAEQKSSNSLVAEYKIVDNEPGQNFSEEEKEDVDIIPPTEIPVINQHEEVLPVNEDKEITPLPPIPVTKIATSGNDVAEVPLKTDNIQKDEIKATPVPDQSLTKSSHNKKKKAKSSSLMPLYLVLILLVFILAGCIWYYFAYSRSFDSFDKEYSTKVSNDTFGLPGDSASEQQAMEKAKILPEDTAVGATDMESTGSDTQSVTPTSKDETTVSKMVNEPAASTSKPATTTKKSTTELNNTKPASSSNANKVLAKITIEPGNRLTLVAEKYYGNKIFWVYIYEYNKDKIGPNPDNVKAGMEILVPTKETYGIDANDTDSREKARKLQAQLMVGKK